MIYFITPYSIEGNYGKACNDYCKLLPENSWICIVDGDLLFLNENWGHHFQDLINTYPDTGLFTCYTNRVGNLEQCLNGVLSEEKDISIHRSIALKLQKEKYLQVKKLERFISGHLMMFSKKTWQEVGGFPEELNEKGKTRFDKNIATVDNRFSHCVLKLGKSILLAEGIYALHYYRLNEGRTHRKHLGYIK